MNRRSFFGFFPAAVAGAVLGVPVVKDSSFWRAVKLYAEKVSPVPLGFFRGRALTLAEREEFTRIFIDSRQILDDSPILKSYIDSRLRIDLERLAKLQAELAHYPARGIVT